MRKATLRVRIKGTPFSRIITPMEDINKRLIEDTRHIAENTDMSGYFVLGWGPDGNYSLAWEYNDTSPQFAATFIKEVISSDFSAWGSVKRRLENME